jgi:tetratricopeptide (TPR) repeat protein/cold shock CspA family protein
MPQNELQILLDNNQWKDAIIVLEKIPNENLTEKELDQLCWVYSRDERYVDSIKVADMLMVKYPNVAKYPYMKGYQFYAQKNYQQAVELFLVALKLYPEYFVVKYRLAYAYFQLAGNYQQWSKDVFWKAIFELEACHKIYAKYDDRNKETSKSEYFSICNLHGKMIMDMVGKLDYSIELFERAIDLNVKDDDDCKYNLAKAYRFKNDYDKALRILPSTSDKYYVKELKAQIFADKKMFLESNKIYETLLRYRKKDYLYCRLAENFIELGEIDKAEQNVSLAIKTDNKNYKNHLLYATICKLQKRYKTAIEYCKSASKVKQIKFKQDCGEAIVMIDGIMFETNNNPVDEIVIEKRDFNTGIITKYDSNRGFGFIQDDGGSKLFFHISSMKSGNEPKERIRVGFDRNNGEKGESAINIKII